MFNKNLPASFTVDKLVRRVEDLEKRVEELEKKNGNNNTRKSKDAPADN